MIAKYSEKFYLLFLLIMCVLFYFNMFDTGCIFAFLTWLTWPMDCPPESGSNPLKRKV
jgi:hypothetical protein